jgi:hypothetical protein
MLNHPMKKRKKLKQVAQEVPDESFSSAHLSQKEKEEGYLEFIKFREKVRAAKLKNSY